MEVSEIAQNIFDEVSQELPVQCPSFRCIFGVDGAASGGRVDLLEEGIWNASGLGYGFDAIRQLKAYWEYCNNNGNKWKRLELTFYHTGQFEEAYFTDDAQLFND